MYIWMRLIYLSLLLLIFGGITYATGEADTIIKTAMEKQKTETSKSRLSMMIYPDADNTKNYRHFQILSYAKGEEASYIEFLDPKSIKGLRILSRGEDQWIFFPSTGRVRKIGGKSKDESVQGVGGDFSYEDLGGGRWDEKYNFIIIKSDTDKWVLEGTPKVEAVYAKVVITLGKEDHLIRKIEYFNKEKEFFKEMTMDDFRKMGGREVATRMTMVNLKEKSKTVILVHEAEYDLPIDEKYFNATRFFK